MGVVDNHFQRIQREQFNFLSVGLPHVLNLADYRNDLRSESIVSCADLLIVGIQVAHHVYLEMLDILDHFHHILVCFAQPVQTTGLFHLPGKTYLTDESDNGAVDAFDTSFIGNIHIVLRESGLLLGNLRNVPTGENFLFAESKTCGNNPHGIVVHMYRFLTNCL